MCHANVLLTFGLLLAFASAVAAAVGFEMLLGFAAGVIVTFIVAAVSVGVADFE